MAAMQTSEAQRNITRNVRILMAARDMYEQKQLGEALGWPSAKMTKTLNGSRKWSVEDLYEVAAVFGVTAGALLGDPAELIGAAGPSIAAVNGSVTRRYFLATQYPVTAEAQVIDFVTARRMRDQGVALSDAPNGFIVRHVG